MTQQKAQEIRYQCGVCEYTENVEIQAYGSKPELPSELVLLVTALDRGEA